MLATKNMAVYHREMLQSNYLLGRLRNHRYYHRYRYHVPACSAAVQVAVSYVKEDQRLLCLLISSSGNHVCNLPACGAAKVFPSTRRCDIGELDADHCDHPRVVCKYLRHLRPSSSTVHGKYSGWVPLWY